MFQHFLKGYRNGLLKFLHSWPNNAGNRHIHTNATSSEFVGDQHEKNACNINLVFLPSI